MPSVLPAGTPKSLHCLFPDATPNSLNNGSDDTLKASVVRALPLFSLNCRSYSIVLGMRVISRRNTTGRLATRGGIVDGYSDCQIPQCWAAGGGLWFGGAGGACASHGGDVPQNSAGGCSPLPSPSSVRWFFRSLLRQQFISTSAMTGSIALRQNKSGRTCGPIQPVSSQTIATVVTRPSRAPRASSLTLMDLQKPLEKLLQDDRVGLSDIV